jgi:hypothetical protein
MPKYREQPLLPGVEIEYRAPEPKPKPPRAPRRKQLALPGVLPERKGWVKAIVFKEDGGVSITPSGRTLRARIANELDLAGVPTSAGTIYLLNGAARKFRAQLTKSHLAKIDAGDRVTILISPESLKELVLGASRK